MVHLLHASNQWVDPNLLQCAGKGPSSKTKFQKKDSVELVEEKASDNDEFEALRGNRIALTRSSAVSDTSDEESSNEADS